MAALTRSSSVRAVLVSLALTLAAAPAAAQSREEHAAWVGVGFAIGSVLVAINGYGLAIEGACVEVDLGGCAASVDQADWLLALDVVGLVLGAITLGVTTYVAVEPSTYGWRASSHDDEASSSRAPSISLRPIASAGPRGGFAGLELIF